ncbi:MAG: FecR domain-containing protein [Anaeromyxobacter sp.]|nr:FecR domain-containing protein [Anaeromyxobacter sp.]MBL0274875.1 FecR domain-containing protein [Anaeromyxobacter sp.]
MDEQANHPDDRLDAEARAWTVRRRSGAFGPAQEAALAAWLSPDPRRQEALERAELLWRALEPLPRARADRRRRRTRALGAAAGVACLAAVAVLLTFRFEAQAITRRGERSTLALPDGSLLELDTDTALRVVYSLWGRSVSLQRGRAHFKVAHERRPFVLEAGPSRIEDLGTAFTVELREGRGRLAVTEGRVRIAAGAGARELGAGEAVRFGHADLEPLDAAGVASMAAWREGALLFDRAPLGEALLELARYHDLRAVSLDARVAGLKLSGRFASADLPGFLATLEAGLPVTARVEGSALKVEPRRR